jgi:hypothetical protein
MSGSLAFSLILTSDSALVPGTAHRITGYAVPLSWLTVTYYDDGYDEANDPLWIDYFINTGDDATFTCVCNAITGRSIVSAAQAASSI